MPRGTYPSDHEKGKIDGMRAANPNISVSNIARTLNRSRHVVSNYLSNPEDYETHGGNAGRKPKLNARDKRRILRTAAQKHRNHEIVHAGQIAKDLDLNVSRWTIARVLNDSENFEYSEMQKAPRLDEVHRDARLEFARVNMARNWNFVRISDFLKVF